ncbi:hypothetical protein [Anaerovibrio sp.]|uniref:hypothetical protein n=1 Tax=Anaerovibrio sp. TaxID=1872532 RepID=UPI0025BCE963|nr:hypothetical protein [Anaerovibrio sp.]MBR2142110.1 hypothetical protein [Anaerovibrio sp.]
MAIKISERSSELETIALINRIILNAEANGADFGGTHSCNEDGLYDSMNKFLTEHSLEDKYDIKKVKVSIPQPYTQQGLWNVFQFVLKSSE